MNKDQIQALQALAEQKSSAWEDAKGFGDAETLWDAGDYLADVVDKVPTLCADLLAAKAEVARLREALAPFASEAEDWWNKWSDDHVLQTCAGDGYAPVDSHFTIGDLRRARAELEGGK